jgi:putative nucleotidyltransferase with HDIG domain
MNSERNQNPQAASPAETGTCSTLVYRMQRLRDEIRIACGQSTRALMAAVEAKDPHTRLHSTHVAHYAVAIGRRLGLERRRLGTIRAAALLHDVGKIGVPDAILTKPGPLDTAEYETVKKHPQTGVDILEHFTFLDEAREIILHHHERHDGHGYPHGLGGDEIPLGARLLAAADAIETMFSPRSYKRAYSLQRVQSEIARGAGLQFDPIVADAALDWLSEFPR